MIDLKLGTVMQARSRLSYLQVQRVFIRHITEEDCRFCFQNQGFVDEESIFKPSAIRIGFIKAWRAKNDGCGLAEAKRVMDQVFVDSDNWILKSFEHWPADLRLVINNKELSILTLMQGTNVTVEASLDFDSVDCLTYEELLMHPNRWIRLLAQKQSQS